MKQYSEMKKDILDQGKQIGNEKSMIIIEQKIFIRNSRKQNRHQ